MPIIRDYKSSINAIKNCVGKTVSDVAKVQNYFNNEESEDGFGNLEITFTDHSFLTLTGLGDAESIIADNNSAEIYKPFHVSEHDITSCKRLDLKNDLKWKTIIGQTLLAAEVVWNTHPDNEKRLSACVLHFDTDFVYFYATILDTNECYVNVPPILDLNQNTLEKL